MSAFSNYLENALINHILRNTGYTSPGTSIYVALFTSDPGEAGGGTEVSGGSYARQQCSTWDAPSNGATQNTNLIQFPVASGNWGTVSHAALFDASTGGNMLFYAALSASVAVNTGNRFEIPAGNFDVALD